MTATVINPGQFRLAQMQVYNWGTFSNLHTVEVGREGFLVTGGSGSGKSTLIDAVSALIVPATKVHYNAAAQEGGTRSGRNLVTYCRGAWRREHSDEYHELKQSYLRDGATWSGINLVYFDGTEYLSAVRLMHLGASCMSPAEITSIFLIFRRKADLTEFDELAKGGLDLRQAKRQFPDAVSVQRGHSPFIQAFRREVGIADQAALSLLHRAQSAKSLGDLNQLMRDFMLPEPETLATAAKVVEQFGELNAAYQSVDTARRQVETLVPIKQADEWLRDLDKEESEAREDRDNLSTYATEFRLTEATEELRVSEGELAEVGAALEGLKADSALLEESLEQARDAIAGRESVVMLTARNELARAEQRLEFVGREHQRLAKSLEGLGGELPGDEESFVNLRLQLEELLKTLQEKQDQASEKRKRLYASELDSESELDRLRGEIDSLQRFRSAMDPALLAAREQIAKLTQIEVKALPFVADLLKVRDSEKKWQPVAERVMGGFARTLLVSDEHYQQVSDAINAAHLGAKIVYVRLTEADQQRAPQKFVPDTLGTKFDVEEGRFFNWIQAQLSARFDYACVEDVAAFRRQKRAVSLNGQVKHDRIRHEKDDRRRIDDRARWVLSGNPEEKFEELRAKLLEAERAHEKASADVDAFNRQLTAEQERARLCRSVLEFQSFDAVDIASARSLVEQRRAAVERLEKGDTELQHWRAKQENLLAQKDAVETKRAKLQSKYGALDERKKIAAGECERLKAQLSEAAELSPASRRRLDSAFAVRAKRSIRADNFSFIERQVAEGLNAQLEKISANRNKIAAKVQQSMNDFLVRWPERRGDLEPTQEFRGDFLKLLEHLEADDLPKFLTHFRELLRKQTSQNLNQLLLQIQRAAADIRRKIVEEINPPLMVAEFDRGTHLQIEVREDQPAAARELVAKLREVVDGVLNDEDALADEQRFHTLKEVIGLLQASDSNPERLVKQRLDTRLHVSFLGVEIAADGARGAVYDSSQGLSGGQAQKLVFFCLAAALRYQLTGAGLGTEKTRRCTTPEGFSRFGTVILDEAFDRADSAFTRKAMDVFTEFGFHMVLATPEKMLQTIEHYIDGMVIVSCADRQHSSVTPIEIDDVKKR